MCRGERRHAKETENEGSSSSSLRKQPKSRNKARRSGGGQSNERRFDPRETYKEGRNQLQKQGDQGQDRKEVLRQGNLRLSQKTLETGVPRCRIEERSNWPDQKRRNISKDETLVYGSRVKRLASLDRVPPKRGGFGAFEK